MIKIKMSSYSFDRLCQFLDDTAARSYSVNWSKGTARLTSQFPKNERATNIVEGKSLGTLH